MTLPTSGPLNFNQIGAELQTTNYSMRNMSNMASKTTPDSVSEFYGYTAIPRSGLLIQVDAGNASSYPGSGTTWTDMSGNGNNATLSGLGYTTDGGGAITFPNNVSTYATFGDKTSFNTFFSFFTFIKRTNTATSRVISKDIGYYTDRQYALQLGSAGQVNMIVWNQSGTLAIASGGANIGTGWAMIGGTWNGSVITTYINGSANATASLSGTSTYDATVPLELGRTQDGAYEAYSGSMAIMLMYNRAVSAGEANTIFQSYRSRFGL